MIQDSHEFERIRQFASAVDTTHVSEATAVLMWPRGVWMNAVKQISENPFQPAHVLLSIQLTPSTQKAPEMPNENNGRTQLNLSRIT